MITLNTPLNKAIYFASDQHFGAPTYELSREREYQFLDWLNQIIEDCDVLFLLGDLFDFWHDYDTVVPRGFVRILGKLAEFSDRGIPVYFFTGNHDLWTTDYLEKELNITVFTKPQEFLINNQIFLIGHGDGLGPGDKGYKRMKKVFTNPLARWCFKWLHPDIGVRLAQYLSVKNKLISGDEDVVFLGKDKEWLVQYCEYKLKQKYYDFFLFGHRHFPMNLELSNQKSRYINTGDWISYFTFAKFKNQKLELLAWKDSEIINYTTKS